MPASLTVNAAADAKGARVALALARGWLFSAALLVAGLPLAAVAQVDDGLLVQPAVPQGFDRGRNVSVNGKPRPDYSPLGIRTGGILIFPRLRGEIDGTTNAYLTNTNGVEVPFVSVEPSVRVQSNWSRHSLQVSGATRQREYIGKERRRERAWNIGTTGLLEFGREFTLNFGMNASQSFESQFSGEVASNIAAVSRFRRDYVMMQGTYEAGRLRAFAYADVADFRFRPLPLTTGEFRDQSDRDRNVQRVIGQVEYARTPSISLFAQLGYTGTAFDGRVLGTLPRRDSNALRALGGANVDLAGRARGTIGIGYSIRDYQANIYETIRGISAEAQLELFPTPLLTITLGAQRTIEDSAFGLRSAFFDTQLSASGDYELMNNLIVSARGTYSQQDYVADDVTGRTYRGEARARYLVSRRITLDASVSYARRNSSNFTFLNRAAEARAEAGISFHL